MLYNMNMNRNENVPPIQGELNGWILDFDRKRIDKVIAGIDASTE